MTGQNAARHRTTNWINAESNNRTPYGPFDWNWKGLTHQDMIYPYLLQQAGYKTIHVGKAHFGCLKSEGESPTNLGFDVNIAGSAIGHPGSIMEKTGTAGSRVKEQEPCPTWNNITKLTTFLSDALTLEAGKEIEKSRCRKKAFLSKHGTLCRSLSIRNR